MSTKGPLLVITAHPGDFVWRAGGAIALAVQGGQRAVIACLSFGERGESASLWRKGHSLDEVKAVRREEGEKAAGALGAEVVFFDAGDYPLVETPELTQSLVDLYRSLQPSVVLTHAPSDPYNIDHPVAGEIARRTRILAQAAGVPGDGEVIGAPPVFCFEPHQPEVCDFRPDVLLDITPVWERKLGAMRSLGAQGHLVEYYTDLGRRRGVQANGRVRYTGDTLISGLPFPSAPVTLYIEGTEGSTCGSLLSTGAVRNDIAGVETTCVDNGMPVVLMAAEVLGVTGYESPSELEDDTTLKAKVEEIRLQAGELMGLGDVHATTVPKMTLVAAPRRRHDLDQDLHPAPRPLLHRRPGSGLGRHRRPQRRLGRRRGSRTHAGGHPADRASDRLLRHLDQGVGNGTALSVRHSGVVRTARKLFDGRVWPRQTLDPQF